ncbi:MAG: hypothetical protein E3J54_03450, partial [Actinobacteria bacterium]
MAGLDVKRRGERQIKTRLASSDTALQRSNTYGFFSRLYEGEPTEKFINELKKPKISEVLQELGLVLDEVNTGENAAKDLSFEYVRLFVGTGPKHAAPWESVYTDERQVGEKTVRGLMWGNSTVRVIKTYKELGYEPVEKFKDMPDHIAVELDFMQNLCLDEAKAIDAKEEKKEKYFQVSQQVFLEKHLLPWIDKFVEE